MPHASDDADDDRAMMPMRRCYDERRRRAAATRHKYVDRLPMKMPKMPRARYSRVDDEKRAHKADERW